MKAKYLPLEEIGDGDFVLINWPYEMNVGVKGTVNESPAVMILAPRIDTFPGPFTMVDNDGEFSAITLGDDWEFDFDPLSANLKDIQRPSLGALTITDRGLGVNGHNREMARHAINESGEFIRSGGAGPIISEWRIVIDGAGDEYRELFRWPVMQDEDEEVE